MSLSSPPPAAPSVHRPLRQNESSFLPGHSGPPRTAQFKTRQEQKGLVGPSPALADKTQSSSLVPINSKTPSPYVAPRSEITPPAFGGHAPLSAAVEKSKATKAFPSIKGRLRQTSFKDKYRTSLEKKAPKQSTGTGQLAIPENLTAKVTTSVSDGKGETASGSSYPDMPGMGSRWERSNMANSGANFNEAPRARTESQSGKGQGSVFAGAFRESLKRVVTISRSSRPIMKIPSYNKMPLSPSQPPQPRVSTTSNPPQSQNNQKKPNPISSTPSNSRPDDPNPEHGFVDTALPGQIS